MKRLTFFIVLLGAAGSPPAWSQSDDMAAERARLANQRIQLEAERIAREEEERAAQAERELALAETQTAEQPAASERDERHEQQSEPSRSAPVVMAPAQAGKQADRIGVSRSLEQIRMLGELRDSGYITEDEFDRIKRKILEAEF